MSGYGSQKWTCGECGESYEASGVVAESQVNRWRVDHKKEHRVAKMTPAEQRKHYAREDEVDREMNRFWSDVWKQDRVDA